MSMDYVRKTYGVPAKRGGRVEVRQDNGAVFDGTITKATHYVWIRLDGTRHARPYHPTDPAITYKQPLTALASSHHEAAPHA